MKRVFWAIALSALLVAGCNLAGDVTPPPGASTGPISVPSQATTAAPIMAEPPSSLPNISQGQQLFEQRCAACHGPAGLGDGEQASDLPVAPSALGDPELARSAIPAEWYQIVTVGRMDRFMPPFNSLSDQERWDVVGYALTLSHREDGLQEGEGLYQEYCSECHADDGSGGDGGPSLVDTDDLTDMSRSSVAAVINAGMGTMPGFSQDLSEQEIWATTAFVQSLALNTSEADMETAETTEPSLDETAVIQGQALNGSAGQPIGSGVEVTLHAFDGQQRVLEETAETQENGRYLFEGVERVPGRLFVISAEYQGVRYSSEVLLLSDDDQAALDLPITLYESTSAPDELQAGRVHVLVDRPIDSTLRVVELWVVLNTGEKTVVPGDQGGVQILLPAEATNLRFEDSLLAERYSPIEGGFQLVEPLRPGNQGAQIVFSYDLPFQGTTQVEHPLTMPVSAATILVAEGGPRIEGEQIIDRGERQAGGEQFHQYDLPSLAADQELTLTLSGPSLLSRLTPQALDLSWVIGGLVLIIAISAILWWYRPWISAAGSGGETAEALDSSLKEKKAWLLTALADLDEAFEGGKVEEAAYRRRRKELKSQLVDLMKRLDD